MSKFIDNTFHKFSYFEEYSFNTPAPSIDTQTETLQLWVNKAESCILFTHKKFSVILTSLKQSLRSVSFR